VKFSWQYLPSRYNTDQFFVTILPLSYNTDGFECHDNGLSVVNEFCHPIGIYHYQGERQGLQGLCTASAGMVVKPQTWVEPVKMEYMQRLESTEHMQVRWMCGVSLKNRISSVELNGRLGVERVADVVRPGRVRWFGHLE